MEKTKTLCDKLNISYDDSQKWEVLRVDVDLPNKRWHVYLKTTTILTAPTSISLLKLALSPVVSKSNTT